ncbi:BLUF domain-containing protein [Sphingomonas sp. FW199]|uniref:BLUF domain-containing protein n=1 Tax=Sphingomonas sp. FW199 TaxID=3400217 RepID=UPI003CEBE330
MTAMQTVELDRTDQAGWIGCITYRSVAATRPSTTELDRLVSRARARNRSVGVTGMLLFDNGRFFQTLEGPPEGLQTIWASVKQDRRHNQIEVLSEHLTRKRLFSDWDLLLYNRPGSAPRRHPKQRETPTIVDRYIRRMVQLALDGDDLRLDGLVLSLAEKDWGHETIISLIIEPAARALGDAWLADECTELDLTIGLSMLQLAGHAAHYHASGKPSGPNHYTILIASAPGEPHGLGSSLLVDQFLDAGWQVDLAFPDSEEALINQLGDQQPDAMDIGLSEALARGHGMDRLRTAIEHARQVATGHPTVISVGGRIFAEAYATAASVGADHARRSATGSSLRMAELVRRTRLR